MNLTLIITPEFARAVKNLLKKYRLLLKDLEVLELELSSGEVKAVELGKNCYKARLQNSSIPAGKSGGFRVIYFYRKDTTIYLLDIYSKTDLENISMTRLVEILKSNDLG
jgi:mRNA-degrading endonuclease RelE of RelBE toxin-antitoxin system